MADRPRIAITMGDPAGIGPEIIVKALPREDIYQVCRPFVLGDVGLLKRASEGVGPRSFHVMANPGDISGEPETIDVLPISDMEGSVTPGKPTAEGGKAMVNYILRAVEMATTGQVAAMVTCPISKELMNQVGYGFEGHTELIAYLTHTKDYVMMLAGEKLRVALATIHCPLRDVADTISKERIVKTVSITCRALERDFGIKGPRVAVAALNPHAGESGLFGREDIEIIKPAVEEARDSGLSVEGPLPADTVFYLALKGRFDAVVAMYHDQGLIPLKLLHFSDAVNLTLGLPIVRTSVDHGTAYDIAGKGIADPSSLIAAIQMATRIVETRRKADISPQRRKERRDD
jgi:4-hydroxythreonine-4-phosphate dehydrogenase